MTEKQVVNLATVDAVEKTVREVRRMLERAEAWAESARNVGSLSPTDFPDLTTRDAAAGTCVQTSVALMHQAAAVIEQQLGKGARR